MSKAEILKQHEIDLVSIANEIGWDVDDFTKSVYSAMDDWGKIKWKQAQTESMKANLIRANKDIFNQRPIGSFTPYKP